MKKLIIIFCCLFFTVPFLFCQVKNENAEFNSHFRLERKMTFDNSVILGTIDWIDVSSKGDVLIVDQKENEVYLFDKNGKLKTRLDFEKCHPGYKWSPKKAFFDLKGKIYVISSIFNFGFLFDENGKPLESMKKQVVEFNPNRIFMDGKGNYLGIFDDAVKKQFYLIRLGSKGNELARSYLPQMSEGERIINSKTSGGGIAVDGKDNIYVILPTRFNPLKYDKTLKYLGELKGDQKYLHSVNYNLIERDDYIGQIKALKDASLARSIFVIEENKILLQTFYRHDNLLFQVLNSEGKQISDRNLTLNKPEPFVCAKNGCLYKTGYPEYNKPTSSVNPFVLVYKYYE